MSLLVLAVVLAASPDAGVPGGSGRALQTLASTEHGTDTFRIRAVGDVMLYSDFPPDASVPPPEDGALQLAEVAPLLRDADLTFANLEGPLCDHGSTNKCKKPGNCYAFRTPTRYGAYLKDAGVDVVSTANNHSGDFGEECRRETEQTLDQLSIAWSGPPGSVASLTQKGKRIAVVAFHTSAATNDVNDHDAAALLVKRAKATHDWVVVSFHGGAEGAKAMRVQPFPEPFYGENRGDLRAFTHRMVDAGADLVIGHGPHVVRGMEIYRNHLIAYSLGNFATYGQFNLKGPQALGGVLEVELKPDGTFARGQILSSKQVDKGTPQPDGERQVVALLRDLSEQDFSFTRPEIGPDGAVRIRSEERWALPFP